MSALSRPRVDTGLPGVNEPATSLVAKEEHLAEPVPTSPSQPIPPLARTPGDLQLARVAPRLPMGSWADCWSDWRWIST